MTGKSVIVSMSQLYDDPILQYAAEFFPTGLCGVSKGNGPWAVRNPSAIGAILQPCIDPFLHRLFDVLNEHSTSPFGVNNLPEVTEQGTGSMSGDLSYVPGDPSLSALESPEPAVVGG